jgi:cob(I)alamin adenosyltransferase
MMMGNRLTRIYTGKGDRGKTSLGNGERVNKSNNRIGVLGDIDEVNCLLGVLIAEGPEGRIMELLVDIQHALFDAGGEISLPGKQFITEKYVAFLEQNIDTFNAGLGELREFILPGGGRMSSICHYTRAVCRRAERHLHRLAEGEPVNETTLVFFNRLSDLLFVLARVLAGTEDRPERQWEKSRWPDK